MKCETCLNKRPIVSENGIRDACLLSSRKAIACMTGRDDKYIQNPDLKLEDNMVGEITPVVRPCPFCGGKATYNEKKVLIECDRCKATIYGHKFYKRCADYRFWLAELWNRRVGE